MSDQEIKSTKEIAQKLINRFPKETGDKLKTLIAIMETGEDPTAEFEIMDLLTAHDNVRRWISEQTSLQSGQEEIIHERGQLGGRQGAVPTSEKWICPKIECVESLPVIQIDEDAPTCSIHGVVMVGFKKKG